MFTYCFNNEFISFFLFLYSVFYIFMTTNAAKLISRFGTIKCYCIVLYCIVLYCIVLYCIVLYCIVLYCIVLYCIVLYCILSLSFINTQSTCVSFSTVSRRTTRMMISAYYHWCSVAGKSPWLIFIPSIIRLLLFYTFPLPFCNVKHWYQMAALVKIFIKVEHRCDSSVIPTTLFYSLV